MVIDEELVSRIERVMFADPARIATPEDIAEEVVEYIEEFIEELEDADPRAIHTSLPALLEDGTVIELVITLQRYVDPDGEANFGMKVAGTSDQSQIAGLLELAKFRILADEDL